MSYYMGDFYRGDFYRGDPGFFSAIGGLFKKGIGLLGGGGGGGGGENGGGGGGLMKLVAPLAKSGIGKMVKKHPVLSAAGGAGLLAGGTMGASRMLHPKVARAMGLKKHRRMRVTNVKALRRSIRRCEGFSRLAVRVLRFTHPHKVRGRPSFKMRRRKKVA